MAHINSDILRLGVDVGSTTVKAVALDPADNSVLFTRYQRHNAHQADTVRQLLLDEIARVRAAGVDREVFTLCKNEKYGQLIENLENVEDSASQMADFALSGQTVAQQISMLAGLTAEDADAALQHILCTDRMATMYIQPDGTAQAAEEDEEEEG